MFLHTPQETALGGGFDSVYELNQEHVDVVRWMGSFEAALDALEREDGWARLRIVDPLPW